jgi:hypothetical protein
LNIWAFLILIFEISVSTAGMTLLLFLNSFK